jgi:hexosaminidase
VHRDLGVAVLALILAAAPGSVAAQQPGLPVIPAPAQIEVTGDSHTFAGAPVILAQNPADAELALLARRAAAILAEPLGRPGQVAVTPGAGPVILLSIDPAFPDTSPEAYRLTTGDEGVRISARGHAGVFYGLQTLRQLVRPAPPDGWTAPDARIVDRPRFFYRGLHLDVARHFFSVAEVERYIDLMARYKLNRFHWHLTDDQGWRIEIKRYPRLTGIGAYRKETILQKNFDPYVGDGTPYGGFYTQDQIREVVAYAAERYVTVIPEIEMPGHALAALAAYPDLACTPGPFEVGTRWGVYDDVFCPTERTFGFLERVLREVMALFRGRYLHVGGDEVTKVRWHASEAAQAVMRREGLANEEELQSYFMRRIEAFLASRGRRLIGWDEILQGGLPPEATVMSWQGTSGGIVAARAGHDVIMSPGDYLYFDHYQGDPASEPLAIGGFNPIERVYQFEPVPDSLTAQEATHVLGAQANMWTEYVPTDALLEYMVFPRALALAEVVWSPRERRDWAGFAARLPAEVQALGRLGVRYRSSEQKGAGGP